MGICQDNLPPAVASMDRRAKEVIFRSRTDGQIVRTGIIAPSSSSTSSSSTTKGSTTSTSTGPRALGLSDAEAAVLRARSVLLERQREEQSDILREYDDDFDDQVLYSVL